MKRLTEKDELGNWCLKGVRWEQLRAGQVITKGVSEVVAYCQKNERTIAWLIKKAVAAFLEAEDKVA